jgi:hypothetical protein
MLPARYPIWWQQCVEWLASREAGEIEIGIGSDYRPQVLHNKLKGMRESIRRYGGWSWEVKEMVRLDELHFEWRGEGIWAIRRPHLRSLDEILSDAATGKHTRPGKL